MSDTDSPKPERNAFQVGFVALMVVVSALSLAAPSESSASVRLFFTGVLAELFYIWLGTSGLLALVGSCVRSATGTYLERAGLMLLSGQMLIFGLAVTATPTGRIASGVFISGLGVLCLAQVWVITRRIHHGERLVATLVRDDPGGRS